VLQDADLVRPTTRRCPRCRFPEAICLCPEVPVLRTRLRFVVLRHASERERLSNTARWGALAIPGTEILEHGLPVTPIEYPALTTPGAVLLFPAAAATPSPTAVRPSLVVVPDGTWTQARRMIQRVAPLRTMPRLGLPEAPPALRLRRPPEGGMSTLEAMAGALAWYGEPDAARRLLALHAAGVERILRLKGTWAAECGAASTGSDG
jgi:tRNA-uridine aminocarboxypropyltransferase